MTQKKTKTNKINLFRNIDKDKWIIIFEVVLLLGMCLVHAISQRRYGDFAAINGTFQNFNPIRRFLDGQIPYKDFTDYLGMGHLYMGSFITFLLGGKYQSSLYAFDFLAICSLALIFFVVGNCLIKDKKISLATTIILILLVIIRPYIYSNILVGDEDIETALNGARTTGNSARFLRGMILPIVCLIFLGGQRLYSKIINNVKLKKYKNIFGVLGYSLIAGFAFIWSNDYGISCCVCLGIMFFVVVLIRTKKIGKTLLSFLGMIVATVAWIFILVEIVTLGHFGGWFKFTFGSGNYQSWYYNPPKSYYVFDIDLSFLMVLQAVLCVLYLYKVFKNKASKEVLNRYGILAFVNMTGFCAVNEYRILSGGASREVALSLLFATIIFEILFYYKKLDTNAYVKKLVLIIGLAAGFSYLFSEAAEESIFRLFKHKDGVYFEELGGNVKNLGDDMARGHKFLKGENFFSTYASGQEVIEGVYQPSGTDYIIHVLGDDSREHYLKTFTEGKHKYTATIKENYSEWEYWVQRANWFFYRELYTNWTPVYSNGYEVYWKRTNKDEVASNVKKVTNCVKIVENGEGASTLVVDTDEKINGIADVYIDYEVKKTDSIGSLLVFRTMLRVKQMDNNYCEEDDYEFNMLRSKNKEYIPVTIVDGHGEVKLTSEPVSNTTLTVNSASCERVFTCMYSKLETIDFKKAKDKNSVVLVVDKKGRNKTILEKMDKVVIGNEEYSIKDIDKKKETYEIVISTKDKPKVTEDNFAESNYVNVIYK